jgi:GNAT superfamily N-acetyltransferase
MSIVLTRNLPVSSEQLNLLRQSAWDGPQASDWQPVLTQSLGWVCATDDDRLIGFVNVAWDGGIHAFLLDTTVDRAYQRRGIGHRLVREATDLARDSGSEWLHVDYEPHLEKFYRSSGFRVTPAALLDLTDHQPS